ncbi:TPA: integrating conjugative element protein [Salmonella enterica subsp. diarizonae serovar 61:l,v:z35]
MLKPLFSAFMLVFSLPSVAALTVVADLGGEVTAPLFAPVAPVSGQDVPAVYASPRPLKEAVFPVVSARMEPGVITPRSLSLPGMTPLFIIGDDATSQRWLAEHLAQLVSLNATGLVVNVDSAVRFAAMQQQAEGLTLLPVSGDDLAQRLQLENYPVLITDTGLSQ